MVESSFNKFKEDKIRVMLVPEIEELLLLQREISPWNIRSYSYSADNPSEAFQTKDLDAYDSDCDDLSSAKAVLMANLLSYDPEVLFESLKKKESL
ncbi:hypothetical protein Tco_1278815 [Tanacetum coccineum]